jgi:protein-S-isoprenylcysteine O-methyltransferase Ste14
MAGVAMTSEAAFRVAFWALLASLWVMRFTHRRRLGSAGQRPRFQRMAIAREGRWLFAGRMVVLLVLAAALVLYGWDVPWVVARSISLPAWLRWLGLAFGLAGVGLLTWARAALGREWSPQLELRDQHHLVTSGPYAWIRHPMYVGMFGVAIALALLSANWCFVLIAAAIVIGFVIRAPREERMMLAAFGEEYRTYMQETGRFFPRLRRLIA